MPTDDEVVAATAGADPEALLGRDYGATLWEPGPDVIERARITRFCRWLAQERGVPLRDPAVEPGRAYHDLWQWSVSQPSEFWTSVWDYFGVLGRRGDGPVLAGGRMPDTQWFPGATLNYARNALRAAVSDPGAAAVIACAEDGAPRTLTYGELAAEVARVRDALRGLGVARGDRVAAFLPNVPEALIGLLAAASLGAIWSSCSPDFGPPSVIDRFAQITPKVLLATERYRYGGREFSRRQAVADIVAALPSLAAVIMVGEGEGEGEGEGDGDGEGDTDTGGGAAPRVLRWDDLPARPAGADPAREADGAFEEVPFGHPLWILYSSGTTGLPKAIVHSHGGIVLEHLKALSMHQDIGPGDVFFWYTTTGWMMWNYVAGGLLTGATVVLYDGSATYPGPDALWRLAAQVGVTYAGTGAPYLLACAKAGLSPGRDHDLSRLRGIGSTGSPLTPEGFGWVYDQVGADLLLGSFSGGTDLCTGFVGPSPLLPVRAGLIAGRCLGAKVEAYDPGGHPVTGEVGELVITAPMPSMPVGFWNDATGARYRASYFDAYPGVWRHGDWIRMLPDGACVIYGRSDATLNRGGVRMGTSEFYRVVERLPEVSDSLVVDTGQLGQEGRLLLYVVLSEGAELDDGLTARIRAALRAELSPRHVPDEIHPVSAIPRTLSGKKLEVPVRKILLGTPVADAADPDALANPEVLGLFAPAGAHVESDGASRAINVDRGHLVTSPRRGAAMSPRASPVPRSRSFGEEGGRLTYGGYLRLPQLLAQQVPLADPPAHDELLFITVHQVYELWFQQLLHELESARDAMTDGQLWRARHLLRRVHAIERLLVTQIDILETMTPQDFLEFRSLLAPASGFQSVQYRELEFLSGVKDKNFVARLRSISDTERDRLRRRLSEPSLWDAYLALLDARGLPTGNDDDVALSLQEVARDRAAHDDLWQLAEDLLTHDELAGLWRARHVQMVERQIGTKSGTGGSSGAPYLRKRVPLRYYPLLWELRDHL